VRPPGWLRAWTDGEGGGAALLTVLAMPALLLAFGLIVDASQFIWARGAVQAAADLAALAAIQEIDLEALAAGERRIVVEQATDRGREVALDNMSRAGSMLDVENATIEVVVYNTPDGASLVHVRDGRQLRDPTVCVSITVRPRLALLGRMEQAAVRAHADASVMEKRPRGSPR
jgi:Flp pilus assembly protein TadG